MRPQVVDPAVSRAKFERELQELQSLTTVLQRRGWWIMQAEFPVLKVAFVTPNCRPAVLILCALLDFSNYDLEPPSVQFVEPFGNNAPLSFDRLHSQMPRVDHRQPEAVTLARQGLGPTPIVNLVQGFPGQPAFICLPGTREYHENSAHTGDSWFLHRGRGEGRMYNILDKISRYGSEPINQFGVTSLQVQVAPSQTGFPE